MTSPSLAHLLRQSKPFRLAAEETLLAMLKTADIVGGADEHFLKGHGITPRQYNVLRIVRGAGHQGMPCGEIGARLISRVPDVTRLLDRMEKAGWIERRRNTPDRRLVMIHLTTAGQQLVDDLDEPNRDFLERTLGQMPADRQRLLCDLLAEARSIMMHHEAQASDKEAQAAS